MDKRRIGVRAIIYRDGKLLAVKHKNKDGSSKDFWAIPGGGLDPGESLIDGLRREIEEELGVAAEPGRLLLIQQFRSTRPDCDEELEFFFLVADADGFSAPDFMQTSHGAEELAACQFIDPQSERVLPSILSSVDLRQLVETVQPVLISNAFRP